MTNLPNALNQNSQNHLSREHFQNIQYNECIGLRGVRE